MTEHTKQEALPGIGELPEYHGKQPVGMRTTLAGAGNRVAAPHTIGDRVVLVVEARVKAAGHKDTDGGLLYVETLKVADVFELGNDEGARLLATMRSLHRHDATTSPLPTLGDVGYTDASGVVLTPDELAALRGDPVRAILSPELTPVVVVYEDGSRDGWPDDYAKDCPRPKAGERWTTDRGELLVMQILHHETGEALEVAPDAVFVTQPPEPEDEPSAEVIAFPNSRPAPGDVPDLPDQWETPDRRDPEEIAADDLLPTKADLDAVNVPLTKLGEVLAGVTDRAHALRLVKAEQQGRGIAAKPRAKAVAMLEAHAAKLAEVSS